MAKLPPREVVNFRFGMQHFEREASRLKRERIRNKAKSKPRTAISLKRSHGLSNDAMHSLEIHERLEAPREEIFSSVFETFMAADDSREFDVPGSIKEKDFDEKCRKAFKKKLAEKTDLDYKILSLWITDVRLFANFKTSVERRTAILNILEFREVKAGEELIKKDEDATECFIVFSGSVNLYDSKYCSEKSFIREVGPRKSIGTECLSLQDKSEYTAVTAQDTEFLVLNPKLYNRILQKFSKPTKDQVVGLLRGLYPLQKWMMMPLIELASCLTPMHYSHGELILEEGSEHNDMLFIVSEGLVRVQAGMEFSRVYRLPKPQNQFETMEWKVSKTVNMGTLKRGQYFGEEAVILGPRCKTVVNVIAETDVVVLSLPAHHFDRLTKGHPTTIDRFMEFSQYGSKEELRNKDWTRVSWFRLKRDLVHSVRYPLKQPADFPKTLRAGFKEQGVYVPKDYKWSSLGTSKRPTQVKTISQGHTPYQSPRQSSEFPSLGNLPPTPRTPRTPRTPHTARPTTTTATRTRASRSGSTFDEGDASGKGRLWTFQENSVSRPLTTGSSYANNASASPRGVSSQSAYRQPSYPSGSVTYRPATSSYDCNPRRRHG